MQTVVLLFKTRLKRKLLAYTFTHPDQEFYLRELAGLIQEDPGNLSRELRRFEEEGLFCSKARGNLKYYFLNKNHPLFPQLKEIVFKTEGVGGVLKDLVKGYSGITFAFIYGSYARGQEKTSSDIDLVVVGQFSVEELTRQVRQLESKLGREINFTTYAPEEFDKEKKKKGGFLNLVLKENIIWLKGAPGA